MYSITHAIPKYVRLRARHRQRHRHHPRHRHRRHHRRLRRPRSLCRFPVFGIILFLAFHFIFHSSSSLPENFPAAFHISTTTLEI